MENEIANAVAVIGGYWQAVAVVTAVVVLAVGAFSLISSWASRHIDTKFEKHAAVMEAHHRAVRDAFARRTKERDDWRIEVKAINERVTDLVIEREVERRMREK